MSEWISVKDRLPERDGLYLTVLESASPVNRCKNFAGRGKPEFTYFCDQWDFKWNARGNLSVAYWAESIAFNMTWDDVAEGEKGRWVSPEPSKEDK